jgi:dTDP-4-amino-4,6-dideoxygalactose transaminase
MKKFNELTNLQKEYFYASGTVAALFALSVLIPPMGWVAVPAAIYVATVSFIVFASNKTN